MGINSLGLSTSRRGTDSLPGIRVKSTDSAASNIYIKWSTESGTEWNGWFDISIRYCYVPRGVSGTGENGYSDWVYATHGDWFYARILAGSCDPHREPGAGGWWWSCGIDIDGLLNSINNGNPFSFDNRKYDAIHLEVHIKSVYADGRIDQWGRPHSSRSDVDLWIGYFPKYTLSAVYYRTKNSLAISYSCPGWDRSDDRWALEVLTLADGTSCLPNGGNYWGSVAHGGEIEIPSSAMLSHLKTGEPVIVRVRMNASFRQSGMDFACIEGAASIENRARCNTPKLTVLADSDNAEISVSISDSDDAGFPFSAASVKMRGGWYTCDESITEIGGTAVFKLPPIGVPIVFSAIAETDSRISDSVESPPVIISASGRFIINRVDSSLERADEAILAMNAEWANKIKREQTVIKLAGRSRSSAYFGTGSTNSISLSGDVFNGAALSGGAGGSGSDAPYQKIGCGDLVMVRFADGKRYLCAVETMSASGSSADPVARISLDMTEVSQ